MTLDLPGRLGRIAVGRLREFRAARAMSRLLPRREMRPAMALNRQTLRRVPCWIDEQVYQQSIFRYGLPPQVRHLIDLPIGDEPTYSDAMLFLSRRLQRPVQYLELGVSVGKNFLQMVHGLGDALLVGFDIESINPTLEGFLARECTRRWPTMPESMRRDASSLTDYRFEARHNRVQYLAGDVFDENAWRQLRGRRFNVIFSDAFHSADALRHEYEMVRRHELLDEQEFVLWWDDLNGRMRGAFEEIGAQLRRDFNLPAENQRVLELRGWLGTNWPRHRVGLVYKLNG